MLYINCRGWDGGLLTIQHIIDLCFIQEHWLINDHLHKLKDLDFMYVAVSGMDDSTLLVGHPFGGCAILYRKSLASCITPLVSCSDRFCVLKLHSFCGSPLLFISVYTPSAAYSATDYLNTLCELESFIDSNPCDGVCIAGDFNVDFGRGGSHVNLLDDFVLELDLVVCDLPFSCVNYTYERDDGLVRSMLSVPNTCLLWFRIFMLTQKILLYLIIFLCFFTSTFSTPHSLLSLLTLLLVITFIVLTGLKYHDNVDVYRSMVCSKLLEFPADVFLCCFDSHCSVHSDQLDFYADHVVSVLLNCAVACFPSRISSSKNVVGWNDCASKLRKDSIFWQRLWEEACCPCSGVCPRLQNPQKRDSNTKFAD